MVKRVNSPESGFTLIEIMIAMTIALVLLAGIYLSFNSQQKTYVVQDDLVEMQQNIRGAALILLKDIREAGCDPEESSGASIETAEAGFFQFTRDINNNAGDFDHDGDTNDDDENITYRLTTADDSDNDGIPDSGGVSSLGRINANVSASFDIMVENVQAIEFNYIMDDGTTTASPPVSSLNDIRAVQISILLRSEKKDQSYTDTKQYKTPSGNVFGPYNDNYRRRFSTTTVYCNNMGY